MLASSAVDRGFESRWGKTKDYKIDICCFSAKHAALRRKSKDWLALNQDIESEWSDTSIRVEWHVCLSGETRLSEWSDTSIWVEWHVYLSGETRLSEWSDTSIRVEWHVCLSGETRLSEWSDTSIWVEWHVYLSGVTRLSEWSDTSIRRLLFQWTSTIKIKLSVLVLYKSDLIIISLTINLFSPWYSWKIAELMLNNNHSITHS